MNHRFLLWTFVAGVFALSFLGTISAIDALPATVTVKWTTTVRPLAPKPIKISARVLWC